MKTNNTSKPQPFKPGDEIAFFPVEIDPPGDPGWLSWDFAVIEEVDQGAETFRFHFVGTPHERWGQGMENIVRRTPAYAAWRQAFERQLKEHGYERASAHTEDLREAVLAEHPTRWPGRFE